MFVVKESKKNLQRINYFFKSYAKIFIFAD
jgi:hypothetical protein